jgi:hypothetical protein
MRENFGPEQMVSLLTIGGSGPGRKIKILLVSYAWWFLNYTYRME